MNVRKVYSFHTFTYWKMTTDSVSFVEIDRANYHIIKQSNVIEAASKKGTKYWQGFVLYGGDQKLALYYTATCSWHTTKDDLSKKVWSTPYYAEPTNVGQSNHRTNEQQAYFEFDSMVNKQTDKRSAERPLPMLAHPYQKRSKYIKFPCIVQPKFDGMRVLYNGEVAWSRGNKPIIPEVFAHLEFDTLGYTVDGELLLPNNPKVNETMSAAKKYRKGISDTLLYRIYDVIDPDMTYRERAMTLVHIFKQSIVDGDSQIIMAESHFVKDELEMMKWHENFVERDYEGTIVRNMDGK